MKIQNSSNMINIFTETAVHDYVAGHMSEESRINFNQMLANDESLRRAVDAERALRKALQEHDSKDQATPEIGEGNFEKLLAQITKLDERDADKRQNVKHKWSSRKVLTTTSVAASIALVTILLAMNQPVSNAPEFTLLSDPSANTNIDFNHLIEVQKVAQVWLSDELSEEELLALLSDNKLTPLGRAGAAWIVSSAVSLSPERLFNLNSMKKFKQVRLISYANQARVTPR
jgi:anti-sigma-K factor RskA